MKNRRLLIDLMNAEFAFDVIDECFNIGLYEPQDYSDSIGMLVFMGNV